MTALNDFLGVDKNGKTWDEFYLEEKERYFRETCKAFESDMKYTYMSIEYAYIVAAQFIEDSYSAKSIFKRLGLKKVHAYAMTVSRFDMKDFIEEVDAILEENAGENY